MIEIAASRTPSCSTVTEKRLRSSGTSFQGLVRNGAAVALKNDAMASGGIPGER
jgi:hypothetical protein